MTNFAPGRVIVKFKDGTDHFSIQSLKKQMRVSVHRQYRLVKGLQVWKLSGISSVEQIIDQYKNDPSIEYIEPDYLVKAFDTTPDDPYFSELWGFHNTGQTGGISGADIDAPAAWDIETGTEILIGVIDTGVDYNHEDLADNIWVNPNEIPNNNQDDDGNGYIDDVRGWDFVNNDNDPYDDNGHGTHCSGTIAAIGNNGIGVVGVNWRAKILPIKFLDYFGSGSTSDAIAAVEYATMMGVKLTSNSWGGGGYSQALYDAIAAAGSANQLFIAAAGNDANNNDSWPYYPASYDLENIIAVSATDHNDLLAYFSNYGAESVDLGAPGMNIYSTTPGNSYQSHDGTSMAAPHVSGAAGLIWAYVPALSHLQVKNTIMVSTDTIPALENITVTGGRLNVHKALLLAEPDSIAPADIQDLAVSETASNWVILSWTASGDDGNTGRAANYDIRYANTPINDDNFDFATKVNCTITPKESGMEENFKVKGLDVLTTYYFSLKVIDEQGNTSNASNSPYTTTLGYPEMTYNPSSFTQSAFTGEKFTQLLAINNVGQGVLDFAFPEFGASTSLGITHNDKNQISLQLNTPSKKLTRKYSHDNFDHEIEDVSSSAGKSYPLFEKLMQPRIQADSTIFFDNMESGINGWTSEVYNGTVDDLWHQTHSSYNSPTTSWWCGIEGQGNYNTSRRISTAIISPSIDIIAFNSPIILQFFEYYVTEWGWDYCMVDISTDDGHSWVPLRGELGNAPCGNSEGWIMTTLDISAYAGKIIKIRFYFDTMDSDVNDYAGWFIDDVLITASGVSWLSFDPVEGSIPAGENINVEVIFDANRLYGGIYHTDITMVNNDPEQSIISMPATLHVTGAPDIYTEVDTLNFGELFLNDTLYLPLVVYNKGTRDLLISSAVLDNPDFTISPQVAGIDPNETEVFSLRFIPGMLGTITGTLTLHCNDPDSSDYIIILRGTGIQPPDIAVAPSSLNSSLHTGQRAIQMLDITNESGSQLSWSISCNYTESAAVLAKSETFTGKRIVDKDKTGFGPERPDQSDIFIFPSIHKTVSIGARALGANLFGKNLPIQKSNRQLYASQSKIMANNLEEILNNLNENFSDISAAIPNRFNFEEGETGYYIGDGGNDMYDVGNYLSTSLGSYLYYANNTITGSSYLGSGGQYFTKKDSGLFVLVADINNIDYFEIDGDLGADGSGNVDGSILQSELNGITYYGFVKRVYNAGDPSVNHLIIIAENANVEQQFSTSTNNDYHQIFNLAESKRIYYLLYAGEDGYYIDNAATLNIMNTFLSALNLQPPWLTVQPTSGTIQAGNTTPVEVTFNATGLNGGDYQAEIAVSSNDPDERLITIPTQLHVNAAPDISISVDTLKFGNIMQNATRTLQLLVKNIGTMDLIISSTEANPADFSIAPQSAGIDPGETETFSINFTPGSPGPITGILTFINNDPDSGNYIIIATGTGIEAPQIAVTPDSLSSKLKIGQNETQILTINNTSNSGILDFLITIEDLSAGNASLQSKNLLKAKPNMKLQPTMKKYSNSQKVQYPYQNKRKVKSSAKTKLNTKFRNLSAGVLFALDYPDLILELDSHTGTIINSFTLPEDISEGTDGLAFDGKYFYFTNGYSNSIYQINKSTGETNSINFEANIDALAHSGEALYILEYIYQTIYKIDFQSNSIIDQHTFPFEIGGGMSFGGKRGTIFISSFAGVIREINPSNWQIINSFSPPNSETVLGLGYSNSLNILYVAGSNNNLIYALNPDNGTILFSFPANIITALASDEARGIPWLSVNPISGTIQGQQSQEIEVNFNALTIDAGRYSAIIVVSNNDPVHPEIIIPVTLSVKGTARITASRDSLVFSETFIGYTQSDSLIIENTGTDTLVISNIVMSDTVFSVDGTHFTLLPDEQVKLNVSFTPAHTLQYSGQLSISSNDSVNTNLNIPLTGYGVHPPCITLSPPDSIKVTVDQGDTSSAVLSLGNSGLGSLNWEILGLTSLNVQQLTAMTINAADPDATEKQKINISLKPLVTNLAQFNSLKIGFTNRGDYEVIISDLTSRGATVKEITTISDTTLNNLDVLALDDRILQFSTTELTLIRNWLVNGKSLLIQADNSTSMSNINTLLAGSGINELYSTYTRSDTLTNILAHPITENVHSVQAVQARGYCYVSSPAQSIILDDSSHTYVAISSLGLGKLLVAGNEIANSATIQLGDTRLFCNQIFDWLAENASVISFIPENGIIAPDHTQKVLIKVDAHHLVVKKYNFELNITSNDPLNNITQIPVIITVNSANLIDDPYSQIPKTYVLMQNYPNPFNPITHIRYGLPKAGHVEIVLYNILGQRVVKLVDENKKAGYHLIKLNADRYASGMYIYRMKADHFTKVKKMLLLK